MALRGFDPERVAPAILNVNEAYSSVVEALTDINNTRFIQPMGTIWASRQAVDFFTNYKSVMEELIIQINKIYESVVNSMDAVATNFSNIAGTTWLKREFMPSTKVLDISSIKEKMSDGNIGVDVERANAEVLPMLDSIKQQVTDGLQRTIDSVNNCSGFTGGEMESTLVHSLTEIQNNVTEAFENIKVKVKEAIDQTVEAYNQITSNATNSFGGGQG